MPVADWHADKIDGGDPSPPWVVVLSCVRKQAEQSWRAADTQGSALALAPVSASVPALTSLSDGLLPGNVRLIKASPQGAFGLGIYHSNRSPKTEIGIRCVCLCVCVCVCVCVWLLLWKAWLHCLWEGCIRSLELCKPLCVHSLASCYWPWKTMQRAVQTQRPGLWHLTGEQWL